jgi:DNA-binding HxlR family transcriptional regulator
MMKTAIEPRDDDRERCLPPKLAAGVALLQEKWALAIVYVLLRGPVGFNGVGRGAGAVNSTTLAQRMARLEQAGVVKKTVTSIMPPRTSYELTEAGRALKPVIAAIERWSERYAIANDTDCHGHAADTHLEATGAH